MCHTACAKYIQKKNLTMDESFNTLILNHFTVFIIWRFISVLLCALAYTVTMSIQNHTDGTLRHLVMKTKATPFTTLTTGWNLKWLMSRWYDSRSDNATNCHRIRMSATQWAQPGSRRYASSYRRFKHTRPNWRWQGRGDARSSWCRVQLASSKHSTSTNTSYSGEIIALQVSPCRGNTSNATAAICSHTKQTQFRNYVSTPRIQLQKKYIMHQLEHKAKWSPTSSAKVKKISNSTPLHSYTYVLHSIMFTHTCRPT